MLKFIDAFNEKQILGTRGDLCGPRDPGVPEDRDFQALELCCSF